jgi:RNA polymerase sigma factor (sigma-70 family)
VSGGTEAPVERSAAQAVAETASLRASPERLHWVGACILPLELGLRRWLSKAALRTEEVDDIVQEVYCRLLHLGQTDHIHDPKAYLYRCARNVMMEQLRRKQIVSITAVQNLDDLGLADERPSPEQVFSARAELDWVLRLIRGLPERCRKVFEMRKVHGLSQAETARALHLSENIIEKETAKGLGLILSQMASQAPGERFGAEGLAGAAGRKSPIVKSPN